MSENSNIEKTEEKSVPLPVETRSSTTEYSRVDGNDNTVIDTEAHREENTVIFTLEKARNIYIARGLKGSINVTRSFCCCYRTVEISVDGTEEHVKEKYLSEKSFPPTTYEKMILCLVNRSIKSLTNRAEAYIRKGYTEDVTLTNNIYFSLPICCDCFTFSVTCNASVKTLLATKNMKAVLKEDTDNHEDCSSVMWLCCV